ncbi:hypothetical protein [Caulobacter phage BL198]|uniref:Uncharacterized protein n=1 Tax=Caulobacter phage BL198 TaxID=3020395 RepID=A0AAE9WYG1_9CAUD|nr:hypothetical protein [Caulobacter phage BL198]
MSDYEIMNLLDLAMGLLFLVAVALVVYCLNNPCSPRRRRRK